MAGQTITGSMVVDTSELAKLANELRTSSSAVKEAVKNITDNPFSANEAGRNYSKQGAEVHAALERAANWLKIWANATTATADAFGKSAITYSTVDASNADKTTAGTK
ncbi:hypothetical protein [Nocardia arthritidis]|uniref:WXG100 family type VII secretion target n=1 Tax=Nocardia arthritidis TaxID=228602 RepID=A0A6G9Y777_9NOCA|nr:hypothetical protein [Nocardia arthritidis]QIS09072.1 hypothetical protein F5544_05800 [Nocardia arthritidis]